MSVDTAVQPSLTVKRRLKAPPAKVFAAWTDPEKIKRWMGPGEIVAQRVTADTRVGGRYRVEMRRPSGEAHNVSGVYREIIPNEKFVFTWAWDAAPGGRTARIAGHGAAEAGRRRHAAHADPRTPVRRGIAHGSRGRLEGALDKLENLVA